MTLEILECGKNKADTSQNSFPWQESIQIAKRLEAPTLQTLRAIKYKSNWLHHHESLEFEINQVIYGTF